MAHTLLSNLNALSELQLHNVHAESVTYNGRQAMRLIEIEIAGSPRANAPDAMRGFVGIAFRVHPNREAFECFYLRPTNGRADDQLRRNHATQYISHPDYPWYRLREENPGVYESYTDVLPGEWTKIKIVVSGIRAELYVNSADQPCLIVNDLKLGETEGSIALWIGAGTEAHFSEIVVR